MHDKTAVTGIQQQHSKEQLGIGKAATAKALTIGEAAEPTT